METRKLEFEKAAKLSLRPADPAEVESVLQPYGSTFADFNEMAVQYGYVALFAPAYPLAPILSMINNIIEIRVDAMRLCYACQRPTWTQAADIGSWYTVLNILGYAAVLTNATMIAFVGYNLVPGQNNEATIGGITMRMNQTYLWVYAVAIEHGIMLTRVLIAVGSPKVPAWLQG